MAATVPRYDSPACNMCDVCKERKRKLVCSCRCLECNLSLCKDCSFTHSCIPACKNHTTVLAGTEGSSVDVYCRTDSGDVEEDGTGGHQEGEGYPQFKLQSHFQCEWEEDEVVPEIRAVILLECGVILATDWGNCTIKSFDMTGRFLGDHYFANSGDDAGRVHGITLKNANTVYVTLPSLKKIASISIQQINDTVKFSHIQHATKRRYFGIAHMSTTKQLIVGTTDTVDILTYSCKIIGKVEYRGFANPYNMGVESPESVLVADTKKNCLFRINANQTVNKIDVGEEYRQLRGVTVDGLGNIYFAGMLTAGVGLARDGEEMGLVLTNQVREAVGVHYQQTKTGLWLVVSEKDGTINVFRIK